MRFRVTVVDKGLGQDRIWLICGALFADFPAANEFIEGTGAMGDKIESDFSFPNIPVELLIEVLICLPVKSLIRFTCVCKSWLYLIRSDHQFAIRHYLSRSTLFSKLMDNANLIIGNCDGWGTLCRSTGDEQVLRLCMYSLTEKRTFRVEKKLEIGPDLNVCVSNFCNGIMCIYVSSLFERNKGSRIFLYNPAIQEVVTLPVSPRDHDMTILGLGFDSTSYDYKILAIFMHRSSFWRCSYLVDVYSVRSGRWHSLHDIAPLEKFKFLTRGAPVLNANGRILNFMGYRNSEGETEGILTFDMIDEFFQNTSTPESLPPLCVHKLLPSSRVRACLCRYPSFASNFRGHELYNVVDIWVLNGMTKEDHVWSKHATIRFPDEDPVWPLNLWMNDRELFVLVKKKGIPYEVLLYDLITHELKKTGRRGSMCDAGIYVESLVSVKELASNCEPRNVGDGGSYLVREFSRINNVCWSHSFNLIRTV